MDWADYLRDEGAKYRQLAETAEDLSIKQELLDLAAVCEEAGQPSSQHSDCAFTGHRKSGLTRYRLNSCRPAGRCGRLIGKNRFVQTVSKFDDFARARLGPGPLSMELANELRMPKVMQLCAAIAPCGFVLPKHLNLVSSDAGNRARSAGLMIAFADPDDAVAQR
jgi:hypothetical protein